MPRVESWAYYLAGAMGRYAECANAELERLRSDVERLDAALVQQMEDAERLRAALRDVVACALIEEPTTDVMIDALDRARKVLGDE